MGVSKNRGGPLKSSIFIGSSIINHPFWDSPIFGNTQMFVLVNRQIIQILSLYEMFKGSQHIQHILLVSKSINIPRKSKSTKALPLVGSGILASWILDLIGSGTKKNIHISFAIGRIGNQKNMLCLVLDFQGISYRKPSHDLGRPYRTRLCTAVSFIHILYDQCMVHLYTYMLHEWLVDVDGINIGKIP